MATVRTWVSTDGNWGTAASWSPSGVPDTGDTAIFPSTSTVAVTSGLNQTAVTLLLLYVDDGYLQDIGAVGNPLIISASSAIKHFGRGSFYWQTGTANTTAVYVDSLNAVNAFTASGASEVLEAYIAGGNCTFACTHATGIDYMTIGGLRHGRSVPTVTFSGTHKTAYVFMRSGTLYNNSTDSLAIVVLSGGVWVNGAAGTIVDYVQHGGTMFFDQGTLNPALYGIIFGGRFDASRGPYVRTLAGGVVIFPQADYKVNYSLNPSFTGNETFLEDQFNHDVTTYP